MKVLVCGGRNFTDMDLMQRAFDLLDDPIIVHGAAPGADTMAGQEAELRGWWTWPCRARWNVYGRAAGPKRNQRMLEEARPDRVLAFPTPQSKGTHDMIRRAREAGVPVEVWE